MKPWSEQLEALAWPAAFGVPAPNAPREEWVAPACALFPGLAARLAATPQDPIHHAEGDVWTHTQMVVDALLAAPAYKDLGPAERGVVFYAALLHDMSKPETTREENGRVIAPGHSAKGAIAARVALWEHGVPFLLREQVCRLIETHQVPFFAFNSRRNVPAEFTARLLAADRSIKLLCMLAEADMRGRICHDQQAVLDDIALFAEQAKELGCYEAPYPFPDEATRLAYFRSQGQRFPDEPVFLEKQFTVTLLSGLPASGKSTWADQLDPSTPIVSYDDLREELGFKHGEGTGTIVHAADDRMREHLRAQRPFVVNATHLSRQMRSRTLERIREYGGQVKVLYFEAPKHEILSRNRQRDSSLTNEKLLKMVSRWEVPGLDEVESLELVLSGPAPKRKMSPGRA